MFVYDLLYGARGNNDEEGLEEWVKRVPLQGVAVTWTARYMQSTEWLLWYKRKHSVGGWEMYLISPWQDPMDRSDFVISGLMGAGALLGVGRGVMMGREAAQVYTHRVLATLAASIIMNVFKHSASLGVIGSSLVFGDAAVQNARRHAAAAQGITLGPTEDVVRTPLNYAVGFSIASSAFTLMDIRPVSRIRNFCVWAFPGFFIGYLIGMIKCHAIEGMQQDYLNSEARHAFYEAVKDS
eukprot:TRINITY_DN22857_c0_g1_i1.p1 TRINITY_DN22857_c0_g1~~TRINITY_DN22857_c0_g1_i1.p1  ORF type:complete len:239 (+),score=36.54 TRINITY_DN22857_c0_g1_i1:54-770(+)